MRYKESALRELMRKLGRKTERKSYSQQTNDSTKIVEIVSQPDKKITDLSRKRLTATLQQSSQQKIKMPVKRTHS